MGRNGLRDICDIDCRLFRLRESPGLSGSAGSLKLMGIRFGAGAILKYYMGSWPPGYKCLLLLHKYQLCAEVRSTTSEFGWSWGRGMRH